VNGVRQPKSYIADDTNVAKIAAPLRDIPQTVTVAPAQVLMDQRALSLQDALKNVPGIGMSSGDGQRDQVFIRGFTAIADQFVDGFRDDGLYFRDLLMVQHSPPPKSGQSPAAMIQASVWQQVWNGCSPAAARTGTSSRLSLGSSQTPSPPPTGCSLRQTQSGAPLHSSPQQTSPAAPKRATLPMAGFYSAALSILPALQWPGLEPPCTPQRIYRTTCLDRNSSLRMTSMIICVRVLPLLIWASMVASLSGSRPRKILYTQMTSSRLIAIISSSRS